MTLIAKFINILGIFIIATLPMYGQENGQDSSPKPKKPKITPLRYQPKKEQPVQATEQVQAQAEDLIAVGATAVDYPRNLNEVLAPNPIAVDLSKTTSYSPIALKGDLPYLPLPDPNFSSDKGNNKKGSTTSKTTTLKDGATVPPPSLSEPAPVDNTDTGKNPPSSNGISSGPISSTPGSTAPNLPLIQGLNTNLGSCEIPGASHFQRHPFPDDVSRWYMSGEYLMWWSKGANLPILATTGPAASNGILGNPGVVPIIGGGQIGQSMSSGFRFNTGYWFNPCHDWGIDANFFFLSDPTTTQTVSSNNYPLIARPFAAPNTVSTAIPGITVPGQFAELTAAPGVGTGSVAVNYTSFLWGADISLRRHWLDNGVSSLDWILGYRYLNLNENLNIYENFSGAAGTNFAGVNGTIYDQFHTTNSFNGGQVGLIFNRHVGRWTLNAVGKVALGATYSSVDINGGLAQYGPNFINTTVPGGLLALNSNIGHHSQTNFSVVPEFGINLGYDVTPHMRVMLGYTFLYWTGVMRPGDQINPVLDLKRIPVLSDPKYFPSIANVNSINTVQPNVLMKKTDFAAQGINFGVRFTW